ncbi:MAG: hypothetical protein HY920_08895 [Elusimicrobia bacterium]|nr:hypothetical protein [Elusimicrobiota bacterium]
MARGPNEIYITQADHVFVIDQIKTRDYDDSIRIQQFSPKGDYISEWIDEDSGFNEDIKNSPMLTIDNKGIFLYRIGQTHGCGKSYMYIEGQISLIPLVPSSVSYPGVPLP